MHLNCGCNQTKTGLQKKRMGNDYTQSENAYVSMAGVICDLSYFQTFSHDVSLFLQ